jgi:hypothetical protein
MHDPIIDLTSEGEYDPNLFDTAVDFTAVYEADESEVFVVEDSEWEPGEPNA